MFILFCFFENNIFWFLGCYILSTWWRILHERLYSIATHSSLVFVITHSFLFVVTFVYCCSTLVLLFFPRVKHHTNTCQETKSIWKSYLILIICLSSFWICADYPWLPMTFSNVLWLPLALTHFTEASLDFIKITSLCLWT